MYMNTVSKDVFPDPFPVVQASYRMTRPLWHILSELSQGPGILCTWQLQRSRCTVSKFIEPMSSLVKAETYEDSHTLFCFINTYQSISRWEFFPLVNAQLPLCSRTGHSNTFHSPRFNFTHSSKSFSSPAMCAQLCFLTAQKPSSNPATLFVVPLLIPLTHFLSSQFTSYSYALLCSFSLILSP